MTKRGTIVAGHNQVYVAPDPQTTTTQSAEVEIKTTTATNTTQTGPSIPDVKVSVKTNPLHQFRSFNYLFTLACIQKSALEKPDTLRTTENYFVIAKSAGKGDSKMELAGSFNTGAIVDARSTQGTAYDPRRTDQPTPVPSVNYGQEFLDKFNSESSGRFDFFINNVEIETIMGGDNKTNMTIATKMKFEIFEPYSLNGFMEAIQTAAIAAGHSTYASAPFLLKMEFIGYPDSDIGASNTIIKLGNEGTRYFVFGFTGIEVSVTEAGTRYSCSAVPHNELAFGEPNTLKTNTKISGKTVGEIFKSFAESINKAKEDESRNLRNNNGPFKRDNYAIKFVDSPTLEGSPVTDLTNTSNNYTFADPASQDPKNKKIPYGEQSSAVQFSAGQSIHDCITAIIRDCERTKAILASLNNKKTDANSDTGIDANGLVNYFLISIESVPQGQWDEKTNKELYNYTYVITPYKLHYTRIPLFQSSTVDAKKLTLLARRQYDYIYTGKNVDITKFNLKFNNLFFQAIPQGLANAPIFSAANGVQPTSEVKQSLTGVSQEDIQKRALATAPVISSAAQGELTASSGSGGRRNASDPYDAMVKNMHQAILDNTDMVTADISILGDPFYLITGGSGNYKPKVATYGETENSEAACQSGDVFIVVNFRNPVDINPQTGLLYFDSNKVPFSGVFRVINVNSSFKDGMFEQTLNLIRVPGQPIDTNQEPAKQISPVVTSQSETSAPLATVYTPPETTMISETALATLTSGNPVTNALLQKLSGATAALNQVSGIVGKGVDLLNQGSQVFGGSLAGLTALSSNLRLASAGLANINQLSIGAASAITQISSSPLVASAQSALSQVTQIKVGSAELLNQVQQTIVEPLTSVATTFGSKLNDSPLTKLLKVGGG